MLLLHGTGDDSVPCQNAIDFSTLLKARSRCRRDDPDAKAVKRKPGKHPQGRRRPHLSKHSATDFMSQESACVSKAYVNRCN